MPSPTRRRVLPLLLAALVLLALGALAGEWAWGEHQLRAAEHALEARDHAGARARLERYLELRPRHARARLLAARAARWLGKYDEAAEHLRQGRARGGDAAAFDLEEALLNLQRQGAGAPGLWAR